MTVPVSDEHGFYALAQRTNASGLSACAALVVFVACSSTPTAMYLSATRSAETVACASIAPSGHDDRSALQAAQDACAAAGAPLVLEAGTFSIAIPPWPRAKAALTATTSWQAAGATLEFSGSASLHDLNLVAIAADNVSITGVSIDAGGLTSGTTTEQTHGFYQDGMSGPRHGLHLSYANVYMPIDTGPSPTRRGDAVRLVGYEPRADGSYDERITSVEVDHITCLAAARSCISTPGGLHGSRMHDIVCLDVNDQCTDGEIGGGGSSGLEFDHITDSPVRTDVSSVGVQIQSAVGVHFHDSTIGRAINVQKCASCEFDHLDVHVALPPGGVGAFEVNKLSPVVSFHDNTITRDAAAGAGPVFRADQLGTAAPSDVTLSHNTLVQHAGASPVVAVGIVGFHMQDTSISYDNTAAAFAVDVQASTTIRTAGISVYDTTATGTFLAGVRVSGSYAGTGDVDVQRVSWPRASQVYRCENVHSSGGVQGPVMVNGQEVCSSDN